MPTDHAVRTVEVAASRARVLRTIRDVASQPEWIPQIQRAEVLEVDDRGRPATARFAASTSVGTDEYTLRYEHGDSELAWTMVEGRLQTGQEGRYALVPAGRNRTAVTYDLTIHHHLPLPGFLRRRVIAGLVDDTLDGLKAYVES